jgi:hypothetical protein
MKKTISNYLVGTIIWCLILTLLFSCNTLKKAENKVLSNPSSVEKIGREWEKSNPCVNDTVKTTTIDTLIKKVEVATPPVLVPFAVFKQRDYSFDTLINGLSIYIDTNGIYISGKYICQEKQINTKTESSVTDNRRLNLCRDSLASKTNEAALYYANFEAAKDSIAAIHNKQKQDLKSITTTGGWFFTALWDGIKWWLIAILIGVNIYTFRKSFINFILKILRLKQ